LRRGGEPEPRGKGPGGKHGKFFQGEEIQKRRGHERGEKLFFKKKKIKNVQLTAFMESRGNLMEENGQKGNCKKMRSSTRGGKGGKLSKKGRVGALHTGCNTRKTDNPKKGGNLLKKPGV